MTTVGGYQVSIGVGIAAVILPLPVCHDCLCVRQVETHAPEARARPSEVEVRYAALVLSSSAVGLT